MADTKITGLSAATTLASTDLLTAVVDPGGSPVNNKITVANFTATLPARSSLSVYASGTVATITNSAALLNFGSQDPTLTITSAGTWLLLSSLRYRMDSATTSSATSATAYLRRTNNTAMDVSGSSTTWGDFNFSGFTVTQAPNALPAILYTTANSNDVIELWAGLSQSLSSGSWTVTEAFIVAIKL